MGLSSSMLSQDEILMSYFTLFSFSGRGHFQGSPETDRCKSPLGPEVSVFDNTGEPGYDRLNGTRKIGPSYAKSVVYI